MPDFAVDPCCEARVIYVGAEREPVLVIDGLLRDPEALLRHAQGGDPFRRQEQDFYPGIRKPLDMAYGHAVLAHLRALFIATFSPDRPAAIEPLSCLLSLTTTPQEQLRPIQSVPHVDSCDGALIAGVHYLCGEAFGGTSFYRHRSTGYERLDAARVRDYAPCLKREVMAQGASRFTYIRGDSALFERTGGVAARFNRAIYYRSNVLHSGDIPEGPALPADPRHGRLTANTLALIRPHA